MSRKSRKNEAFDLPSFQMIRAASNGDIEAINAVLKHYEGYIAHCLPERCMTRTGRFITV